MQNAEGAEAGSEQIGMVAALVILLIAFGSVLAAGLPIVVALFGVGRSAPAHAAAEPRRSMIPDWAPQLATMIGIGVGIDYALFIVTRYRAALADGHGSRGRAWSSDHARPAGRCCSPAARS